MKFGEAIQAMQNGKMVSRSGWNGKGLFVFMQVPAEIGIDIVPKMQSLPQEVKDEFVRRSKSTPTNSNATETKNSPFAAIRYHNQLALVDTINNITGWSPSTPDALANDWCIVEIKSTSL